jgi:hypothetical protein
MVPPHVFRDKKQETSMNQLGYAGSAGFLLVLFFDPEGEGDMFF